MKTEWGGGVEGKRDFFNKSTTRLGFLLVSHKGRTLISDRCFVLVIESIEERGHDFYQRKGSSDRAKMQAPIVFHVLLQ